MSGRLEDKVAFITGAASGIGRACAFLFAHEGARLVASDVDTDGLEALRGELEESAAECLVLAGDVTRRARVEEMVDEAVARFSRIDVLVNSAGITRRNVPADADFEEAWDKVMAVNLKGTLLMCHAVAQVMTQRGGGAIVNLSSIMGLVTYPDHLGLSDGFNPYPHSKGGVLQLTRDLAVNLAKSGVRANAVCPGFVYTPLTRGISANEQIHETVKRMHPMGRLGEPEEVARAILFLASDDASFVTGAALTVDGGYTAV